MGKISLGCCIPGAKEPAGAYEAIITGQKIVKESGFDYIEISAGQLMALTEKEFYKLVHENKNSETPIRACNGFIPPRFKLAEKLDGVREYVSEVMQRLSLLGADVVVFGSGKARAIPENSDGECFKRLYEFLGICSEYVQKYSVMCAIEPLRTAECNWINTVSEALTLSRELNLPGVKVLADAYHMADTYEDLSVLKKAGEDLIHVHVAEPDRSYPGKNGSDYLDNFLKMLKECGYTGRISVEGRHESFQTDCAISCRYLKNMMN